MTNKPKIAVIGLKGLPAFGGAATVGENIIEQLKNKYEFIVYSTSSHTKHKTGELDGYNQIVFRKIPFKKLNTLYYYIISTLHAVIFGQYDLVHVHHRDAAFITMILKLRYKVVITTHSSFFVRDKWKTFSWYFQINERLFVKKADVVTCVSLEEKKQYKKYVGFDTIYIPNGINIYNGNEIDFLYNECKPYLFFGAGRIIKTKGLEVLLKALHNIKFISVLLVAGDLNQTPDYKREILKLANGLNVKFIGMIKDKNKLLSIIKGSTLFIFPSSYEAMSMMLLEAVSTKCPSIVSDIKQNKDIFNHEEVLFFKTDDHIDLAEKIRWALNNPEEMKIKAENAYEKLITSYQWKNIAKQYSAHYNNLLYK